MKRIGLWLLLLPCLATCRENGSKTEVQIATDASVMHLEARDTVAVQTLVALFMDWAKAGKVDSAVMLLRTAELYKRPQPLGREAFRTALETFGQFPVEDYEVEHIVFRRAYDNEVKCRVRTPEGRYINRYFKPIRYLGCWSLCLKEKEDTPLK